MKATLKQIWDDGLISFITKPQWDFIEFTNALAIVAIVAILTISMPTDAETINWILMIAVQLALILTIHSRASNLERKMIEIDTENDKRDNHMRNHVELVYQDVRWLVGREMSASRKDRSFMFVGHLGHGNPNHPDFVGPRPEFDSRKEAS